MLHFLQQPPGATTIRSRQRTSVEARGRLRSTERGLSLLWVQGIETLKNRRRASAVLVSVNCHGLAPPGGLVKIDSQ